MSDHGTAIGWTHIPGYKGETWNPVTGCDRVSPGCAHCYALELASRLKRMGQPRYQKDGDPKTSGPGFGVTLHPDKLSEPLRWRSPRAVFVNSMSDLFHEAIPDEFVARIYGMMARAESHIFMVLTKRPERMRDLLCSADFKASVQEDVAGWPERGFAIAEALESAPLPNVWLGVTIENRRFVHRADLLRQVPAAVRFISAEPLLGPLVHNPFYPGDWRPLSLVDIDWLIVGGESGPRHRPMKLEWVRDLLCTSRGERRGPEDDEVLVPRTPFFFKQWGGAKPTSNGRLLDGRTYDEFPAVAS